MKGGVYEAETACHVAMTFLPPEKWHKEGIAMHKFRANNWLLTLFFGVILLGFTLGGVGYAKSVYLSADHHTAAFDAWNINFGGTVTYAATYTLNHSTDPAGIGIDVINPSGNSYLFISSEFSPGLEIVDPVNLTYLGVSAGPEDLAGVDVDDQEDYVYALGRASGQLYIYKWDEVTLELEPGMPIALENMNYGYGLSLDDDEDILWVTDTGSSMVRAYDVGVGGVWTDIKEITVANGYPKTLSYSSMHTPVDVVCDSLRDIVYTVGSWAGSTLLCKWDVAAGTETSIDLVIGGIGCAVDEDSGHVYLTRGTSSSGDDIQVWDCNSTPWTLIDDTDRIGNPAGIVIGNVSYNPLDLTKDDGLGVGVGADTGSDLTYTISFDNTKNPTLDINNVALTDQLPPNTMFVSATGGTGSYSYSYDAGPPRTVTWDIGYVPGGMSEQSVELTVRILAPPESTLINGVNIDGDEVPPTNVEEYTDINSTPCGAVLLVDTDYLSINGGMVNFSLIAGIAQANQKYILLGSKTGTSPGFPLPGGYATLPLNRDKFSERVFKNLNTPLFFNFQGVLDGSGNGSAVLDTTVIGPLDPSLVGRILYFAYATYCPFDCVSNPVGVEFVP